MVRLLPAGIPELIPTVRELFLEYQTAINAPVCFETFDRELAALPGDYAPPAGALLIGEVDGAVAGCAAMRNLGEGAAEMKRLYVRPAFRGSGLGRILAQSVIESARSAGYSVLRLDTLESMTAARQLYSRLGFVEIPSYHASPGPGVHYMELRLANMSGR